MDDLRIDVLVVAVAVLGLAVASLSARIDRLPLSEPLVATGVGVAVGPQALDLLGLPPLDGSGSGAGAQVLGEVAVVLLSLSMMAIALRYPWPDVRRAARSAGVLVGVAMPLMALVSAGVAWLVLGPAAGLGAAAALLLGAAVCPTDPVLSSSVVTGELAERDVDGRARRLLSLESGANDALALPLVVVAVAVAGPLAAGDAAVEVVRGVLGGLALGLAVGYVAARAVRLGESHGATEPGPVVVFTLVLAVGVLAAAHLLKVAEVLAVLVAGLALNAGWSGHDRVRGATLDEALNRYAVLPFFVLLGAALPWSAWAETGWVLVPLVVGVLVLRRLPVLLLLARPLRLPVRDAVFLGWFGPIGVSGLYYLLEVAHRVPGSALVVTTGVAVVAASTVVHGLTGSPGRVLYRRFGSTAGVR
jgi:NhaP-type Na+/H+ or K+/H+ antiporter